MTTLSYHSYVITTTMLSMDNWRALATLDGEELYESSGLLTEREAISDAQEELDLRDAGGW